FHARFGALLDELAGKGYRFVRLEDLLEGEAAPLRADDVFIRASQVGYEPRDSKLAMALSRSALPVEFAVVDAETGAPVFTGRVMPVAGGGLGRFDSPRRLRFQPVGGPGRYIVKLGEARSLPFVISERALADLPDQLLEFMRQ